MQLQPDLWIEGPFYIDFTAHGELRVVGPGNLIYLGLPGHGRESLSVEESALREGQLRLVLGFDANTVLLGDPVIRDVRFIRRLTEGHAGGGPSFAQLIKQDYSRVGPETAEIADDDPTVLILSHRHGEDRYGCRVRLLSGGRLSRTASGMATRIEGDEPVRLEVVTHSSGAISRPERAESRSIDLGTFRNRADFIRHVFIRTTAEITRQIGRTGGPVAPRNWLESAALGVGDFTPAVIDMIFRRALAQPVGREEPAPEQRIDPLSREARQERVIMDEISRTSNDLAPDLPSAADATDIAPRILIGMELLSADFWKSGEDVDRLRRVAAEVLGQARTRNFIVLPHEQWERRDAGAWRDSRFAYGTLGQPIADFSVNAVFYPAALRAVKKYRLRLKFSPKEIKEIDSLLQKWDDIRNLYSYRTKDGHHCFALALGGAQRRGGQLIYSRYEVTHTDEAYYLLYLEPTREEVISFAERLLDPNYFYTSSGPLIVGAQQLEYTSRFYHGKVIWTKHTGLISAAVMRQIERARKEKWAKEQIQLLEQVIHTLFNGALSSFAGLGEIPDVYADDDGEPIFFDDQIGAEPAASRVSLWSAVGARRIIRDYYQLIRNV